MASVEAIRRAARRKTKRRYRRAIKYEWKDRDHRPAWAFVRERLVQPSKCAKGSYLTLTHENTRGIPPGLNVISCCPKGAKRTPEGPCRRRGKHVVAITQALAHHVERFKIRHPDVWTKLLRAKPTKSGLRTYRPGKKGELGAWTFHDEGAAKAYMSMGAGAGYKSGAVGVLAGLFSR